MCDQYYSAFTENKNLYLCPENTRPAQTNFQRLDNKMLHYTQKSQSNINQKTSSIVKYSGSGQLQTPITYPQATLLPNRNRYMPYNNRTFVFQNGPPPSQSYLNQASTSCNRNFVSPNYFETDLPTSQNDNRLYSMAAHNTLGSLNLNTSVKQQEYLRHTSPFSTDQQILGSQQKSFVTLQISNLDNALEETNLRSFLLSQLKPITPIVSIVFEGSTYVKVTVPDLNVSIT